MKNPLCLAAILVIALSSVTRAQQQESSVSAKNAEASAKLLLEVVPNPELPPSYITVNGAVWITRFVRLSSAPDQSSIRTVNLYSKFNGETAEVRVLLRRASDQEDLVGVYQIGVGEKKTLNDLRAVGVEPFSITLLSTVPPLPPPPSFDNRTKSIDIVSVQSENMPKPAYRVTFRNLSDKNLLALRVDVFKDGRPGTSALLQGEEGQPAIEAGGIIERYMPADIAQRTATGYAPGTAAANTVVVRTAVFADMSFEGEPESACLFESFQLERRVWVRTVLALLNRELAKPTNEDQIEAARQFKEKFAALNYEFREGERDQASVVSTVCAKPSEKVRFGILKLQVLRELDDIITTRPAQPVNFRLWLETHRAHYIAWLTRL